MVVRARVNDALLLPCVMVLCASSFDLERARVSWYCQIFRFVFRGSFAAAREHADGNWRAFIPYVV